MIEIQYKTDDAYSFHAFNLKELRQEVSFALKGKPKTVSEILIESEKRMKQKELAKIIGVTPRYLRYVKTGKRLKGTGSKKEKSIRRKIFSIGKKLGLKFGGYTAGQLRAADYLDFVCEKDGEVVKDIHEIYYEHGAQSISHIIDKGLYDFLQNNMHDAINMMCFEGRYCDNVLTYRRGNKHSKKAEICDHCGKEMIAVNNKKLIYTVVMKK